MATQQQPGHQTKKEFKKSNLKARIVNRDNVYIEKRLLLHEYPILLNEYRRLVKLATTDASYFPRLYPSPDTAYSIDKDEEVLKLEFLPYSLHDVLTQQTLSFDQIAHIGASLVTALQIVHTVLSCAHNDIKPANVLVSTTNIPRDCPVVLIDFGSCTIFGRPCVSYTPQWCAPSFHDLPVASPLTDLYSVGLIMLAFVLKAQGSDILWCYPKTPTRIKEAKLEAIGQCKVTFIQKFFSTLDDQLIAPNPSENLYELLKRTLTINVSTFA